MGVQIVGNIKSVLQAVAGEMLPWQKDSAISDNIALYVAELSAINVINIQKSSQSAGHWDLETLNSSFLSFYFTSIAVSNIFTIHHSHINK